MHININLNKLKLYYGCTTIVKHILKTLISFNGVLY